MRALPIYSLGIILFLASLFSPAYSPYGAWDYTGWDAINAALHLRPRMLLDLTRIEDVVAIIVIVVSGLNSVFVMLSPLLFPIRVKFNRRSWFWSGAIIGIVCILFIVIYMHHAGFIQVRFGYYLWLGAVVLVYLSFHPRLK